MTHGRDSLSALIASIQSALGSQFQVSDDAPDGAKLPTHFALTGARCGTRVFIKTVPAGEQARLASEAEGLEALRRTQTFKVPEAICRSHDEHHAWLVLEWLELHPMRTAADGERVAGALAGLHGHEGTTFGWASPNFIGSTPQINAPSAHWARFFAESRLGPQLAMAARRGFTALSTPGERLLARLPALLHQHTPAPSLVHGDFWHGNVAVLADGTPTLFDPAIHYGDSETDLAMSELFGAFPDAFYAAYQRQRPPQDGATERKILYKLYHLLNHLNLFGGAYQGECLRHIQRALALT